MKKVLLLFSLPFIFPVIVTAQESVGFADPDNIRPLLDYRLPDWGYSNLYFNFSLNGNFDKRESDDQPNSFDNNRFSGQLSPFYFRFRESEPRVSTYRVNSNLDYSRRNRSSFDNEEDYRRSIQLSLNWNLNEKLYVDQSDLFFTGRFSGTFHQNSSRDRETVQAVTNLNDTQLNRQVSPSVEIGIGYGRIRNVNPMIRALRLNERFQALDHPSMNSGDIMGAADHFTRLNGYQQTYDRPQKHFWNDMDPYLSADLSNLDAFDLLYLTETTVENLGARRQGWEISANAGLQHLITFYREEDELSNESSSDLSRRTLFIPSLHGTWSKNLSLNHQVSLMGTLRYQRILNEDDSPSSRISSAQANWLYTVTDRVLTNTSILYTRSSQDLFSANRISIGTQVNYFLENRISLFTTLAFDYNSHTLVAISDGTITYAEDRQTIRLNAGIRYYLKRGLF